MAFKHVLKSIRDPKIALKEMSIWDDSESRNNNKSGDFGIHRSSDSFNSNEHVVGRDIPYIQIGEYTLQDSGIHEVIIDETEFIPTIQVMFTDERTGFNSLSFPKNNPIMSVYIKPPNKKLKPIRNDYLISDIRRLDSGEWVVKGELFIPKLYQSSSKSYSNSNSKSALDKLCEELGLGFQANDFDLADIMTWINPNMDSYSFMKHIIRHAYQDDDSFFGGFIDKYYHLNMININAQLEHTGDIDQTILSAVDINIQANMDGNTDDESNITSSVLLKYPGYNLGANAIIGYDIMTEHGDIIIENGYRKRIYYYDQLDTNDAPKEKLVDFYMRPILSSGAPDYTEDLEPDDDDLKNGEIRKWMGIDYGNTHEQYQSATLLNHHNNKELEKITLKIGLSGINWNVTKGQRIPVGIFDVYSEGVHKRSQESSENKQNLQSLDSSESIVSDEYLSGIYYVKGTKYVYHGGQYSTVLYLSRRDWKPVPSKSTETNNDI